MLIRSERQHGFSLLEMMVAMAILAMSLGALYQAASGATRNVRTAERYAYGVELARSLLANNAIISQKGVSESGETAGGYEWRVESAARPPARGNVIRANLHDLEVNVSRSDGSTKRRIVLNSVVESLRQ